MPSMVTRSKGGWSRSARTDWASAEPAIDSSGRSSSGSGRTSPRTSASASAGVG